MGRLLVQSGQVEKAMGQFERALDLDRKSARHHDIARDLEELAASYAAVGDHIRATHFYKRSAKIYALLKDKQRIQSVVLHLEKSASMAEVDIQPTMYWVHTWLKGSTGVICE